MNGEVLKFTWRAIRSHNQAKKAEDELLSPTTYTCTYVRTCTHLLLFLTRSSLLLSHYKIECKLCVSTVILLRHPQQHDAREARGNLVERFK